MSAVNKVNQLGLWPAVLLVVAGGCGGKYDLQRFEGTVTLTDGTPGSGLHLSFECDGTQASAQAMTDESGHYRVGILETGGGAPPGHYRVAVVEAEVLDIDRAPAPKIHSRYARFDTSGLEFTVEEGTNTFNFQLDPP